MTTNDPISDFFESLAERGHEPLLEKMHGTVAVELTNGADQRWLVSVDGGDMRVERGSTGAADCTFHTTNEVFARVATGEANAMAALIRGAFRIEGDLELLALFYRVFPGPPSSAGPAPSTPAPE
jgi:putative sterol carrier protein